MPERTEKCAHPSCQCPAKPGSRYCSTYFGTYNKDARTDKSDQRRCVEIDPGVLLT
jgi:hypothetical protein